MLPLLRLAAEPNAQPLAIKTAAKKLATQMQLSEADRSELLPSGRQSRFTNRVHWAASHLRAAKLLESAGRGCGVDGVIEQDKLGLDVVYLQAKRWQNTVGRPDVQQFAGALAGQQANRGVFLTTSDFSSEAVAYAKQVATKIVLISGRQLAEYMFDHDLGVTSTLTLSLKKIDSGFFEEE